MNWYKLAKNEGIKLQLTSQEKSIFDFIKEARNMYLPNMQLRIVGGWVRDRILNKISDDIDVSVSGGNGHVVAEAVRKYDLEKTGGKHTGTPYSVSLEKSTEKPSGKSAGLLVGAVDINGIKVEFVPMRKESYSSDSRIPTIEATDDPREDVLRRDLTINAIYYNLDTGEVEDYSGGINDLKNGVIKTPTDPIKTLTEDPLRAMRALRFLSQMRGFKMDPSLIEALSSPLVHESYSKKVAPERVRKELEKLALGKNPADALRILFASGLYPLVFNTDKMKDFKHISMDQQNPKHAYNLLEHTVNVVKNLNDMLIEANFPDEDRLIAVLAAIFHDFGKMDPKISRPSKSTPGAMSYPGHEDVSAEIAEEVLRRLGFGNERFLVEKIVKEHMRPHGEMETPKSIGKFLREFDSLKMQDDRKSRLWRLTWLHAVADSMSKGAVDYHEDVKHKQDTMKTIEDFINNQASMGKKPLLDGKEIMQMFPEINPKTGFIKIMQEALLQAQDEGKVIDKNSAEKFLKDNKNNLMTI